MTDKEKIMALEEALEKERALNVSLERYITALESKANMQTEKIATLKGNEAKCAKLLEALLEKLDLDELESALLKAIKEGE